MSSLPLARRRGGWGPEDPDESRGPKGVPTLQTYCLDDTDSYRSYVRLQRSRTKSVTVGVRRPESDQTGRL